MLVADKVHALNSTKGAYVYIILGEEMLLIDTGLSFRGKKLIEELYSMNIDPHDIKHILLTHHDLDHIGNAARLQRLTGAQVWSSKEDIPYINGEKKRPGIKKIFTALFRPEIPGNIRTYEDSQRIGGAQIIPTPGHTPGHVCILYNNVLFTGDLVKTKTGLIKPYLHPLMTWDRDKLLESVKKVVPLPFKWVCPAHGSPVERSGIWEVS
jgi:glyoxylase-like metal-dependent hydrolase (beta-lactamase superfamily II)